jgi:hypothetical protein
MKIETLRDITLGAMKSYTREIREKYGKEMKAVILVAGVASRARLDTCSTILGLTQLVEEGKVTRESAGGTPTYSLNE